MPRIPWHVAAAELAILSRQDSQVLIQTRIKAEQGLKSKITHISISGSLRKAPRGTRTQIDLACATQPLGVERSAPVSTWPTEAVQTAQACRAGWIPRCAATGFPWFARRKLFRLAKRGRKTAPPPEVRARTRTPYPLPA
jgi:hypothetical protein